MKGCGVSALSRLFVIILGIHGSFYLEVPEVAERLSLSDFAIGAQSILRSPPPPGYPTLQPHGNGRLFTESPEHWWHVTTNDNQEKMHHKRYILEDGSIATATIVELPPGHDTNSEERASFLRHVDPSDLLFPPIPDLETGSNAMLSDEHLYGYLERGYRVFDQHRRPIPWAAREVLRFASLRDGMTGQPVGAAVGNGSFIQPGNHPASDAYILMPLPGERPDFALLAYGHREGVWAPPGAFGLARDTVENEYLQYETACRAAHEKVQFDIEEFPFEVVSRRPVISEYTTLNSRLEVVSNLVRLPYSREIARNVADEVPQKTVGTQWISVRSLLQTNNVMWPEHARALAESVEQYQKVASRPDVFLSFAGPERAKALKLANQLGRRGLKVFVDNNIKEKQRITETIEAALSSAKVMVVYYSRDFASRAACQLELQHAYLAGQLNDEDATRRIIVLNPDDPYADHIMPKQLANEKYFVPTATNLDAIAQAVDKRVASTKGRIGALTVPQAVDWYGRGPTPENVQGKHTAMWQLHDALTANDYRLISDEMRHSFAVVTGPKSVGKTALVNTYGLAFGAVYPGGIYWLDTSQAQGEEDALMVYERQLRKITKLAGLPQGASDRYELLGQLGGYFRAKQDQSLWVVDHLPSVGFDFIHEAIIPSKKVSSIFMGRDPSQKLRSSATIQLSSATTDV